MKICVFGAGAIGGHIAARLAKGGADVSVVARGAQRDALAARGLTVRAPDGEWHCTPRVGQPEELGPQDAVLVTTKQTGLGGVARAIAPLLGPETSVTFVMNGIPWWYFDATPTPRRLPLVDPGDVVRDAIGVPRTIGGVVWSACTVVEPGVVQVASATSRLILGEVDGRISPRAQAIADALKAGGMGAKVTPDIRTELWNKLIGNLANGPLCLLSRLNIRETFQDAAVKDAALRVMEEAIAIAKALGVPMQIDAADRIARSIDTPHKPSILQDLEAGRPMEIDSLFLQPLELGRDAGVAAPMLELTVALARQAARATGTYP